MKTNGDRVTVREVYELVATTKKDISHKVDRLEYKFDMLEAGRLTNLETKVAEMQGKQIVYTAILAYSIISNSRSGF